MEMMPELNLVMSEKFGTSDAAIIRARIAEHLRVGEPQFLLRKSADATLTSIIQVLGDAAAWLPLPVPATIFLSTIAKRAGDATWNHFAVLCNKKEIKPLADVAFTLASVSKMVDGKVEIVVGLDIPDDHFGTAMSIGSNNPEEIALKLSHFVVHANQLSKTMQSEVDKGHAPLGPAVIELQEDGSLSVKWRARSDSQVHEVVVHVKRTPV